MRLFAVLFAVLLLFSSRTIVLADQPEAVLPAHVARIKDVTAVEGIRDNQLIGYGLVVGLAGTGDKQQTIFSVQTLGSMLQRMGVSIQNQISTIQVRNIAAVFVVATLPPFSRPGMKIDVTVSSIGDAKSLAGGRLLLTPLNASAGKVYPVTHRSSLLLCYRPHSSAHTTIAN